MRPAAGFREISQRSKPGPVLTGDQQPSCSWSLILDPHFMDPLTEIVEPYGCKTRRVGPFCHIVPSSLLIPSVILQHCEQTKENLSAGRLEHLLVPLDACTKHRKGIRSFLKTQRIQPPNTVQKLCSEPHAPLYHNATHSTLHDTALC